MDHTTRTPEPSSSAATHDSPVGRALTAAAIWLAMYAALVALTVAWSWTLGSFGG